MLQLLEQLTRNITTTEVWWGILVLLLLGVGLRLLGYGLGFTINFDGWIPLVERISNEKRGPHSLRVVSFLIGIGLFVPGLIGLYRLTSVTTLKVLTSLSEEEYAQFQELEVMFHKKYEGEKLRIRSENVNWPDLLRRLKQERIDVIIFDVTRRLELLRENLLKPLEDHRLFIPSSVYPALLDDNVNFNKRLYFLPYRPNVRIGWWNSHHPTALAYAATFKPGAGSCSLGGRARRPELPTTNCEPPGLPKTWQDVKKFAAFQHAPEAILDQYGVVLSARGAKWVDEDKIDPRSPPLDAALLLLEVLRASGKEPWQLCEIWQSKKEDSPLNVLRDIYNGKGASPRSRDTDWQTATGHLLSRHVALARNWSFSISAMRNSGELQNFHPYVAWAWKGDGENNTRLRTLLGGDAIALPRYGRHGDAVDKLLRFLISKDAQGIFVENLTWPPMRFDVKGEKDEGEKDKDKKEVNKPRAVDPCPDAEIPIMDDCHDKNSPPTGEKATKCECLHLHLAHVAVRDAMQHAEPPPRFWSPEMHESFTSAFQALVKEDEEKEDEEKAALKFEEAAGLYCLAPRSETPIKKKKLADFIELRFEGDPNTTLKDVLPKWLLNTAWLEKFLPEIVVLPKWLLNTGLKDDRERLLSTAFLDKLRIRVKLVKKSVKAEDPPKAASHHTDLCVQLYSDNPNDPKWQPIRIPAGFTSKLSEPLLAPLFRAVEIKKGNAWELTDTNAQCDIASLSKSGAKPALVSETPLTVVVLPFTLFAFLVLGALIGRFFESGRQQKLLKQLWKAAREQFTITRGLQVLLFILVVPPLWFTLERLEYAKEVSQFFSDVPVQAWLIPLALLLGFVLEMVVEKMGFFAKPPKSDDLMCHRAGIKPPETCSGRRRWARVQVPSCKCPHQVDGPHRDPTGLLHCRVQPEKARQKTPGSIA